MLTEQQQKVLNVHEKGRTSVAFCSETEHVVTSGSDGKVAVWYDIVDDDEPFQVFKFGGDLCHFAILGDTLYRANEKGTSLMSYNLSDGQTKGIITRFTASITDITSSSCHVAVAASDFKIKVLNLSEDVCVLSGHEAPVLSVSLSPVSGHLLSTCCDGTVKLWTIKTKCCLRTYNLLPKYSDISLSKSICKPCWSHDGLRYAIPVDNKLLVYNKDQEEPTFTLTDDCLDQAVLNVCSYNTTGTMLAAATTDGTIIVWSTKDYLKLYNARCSGSVEVTGLSWSSENHLLFTTSDGSLSWCDIGGSSKPTNINKTEETAKEKLSNQEIADMFDDDDEDMDDDKMDDEDFKDIVEEYEEEVKQTGSAPKPKSANKIIESDDDDDDDVADGVEGSEIGDMDSESLRSMPVDPVKPSGAIEDNSSKLPVLRSTQQPAFQPGSTTDNPKARYLVWNIIGVIKSYNGAADSTIDIEFHDISKHHTIHVNNTEGYCMGDLGEHCAVLATKENSAGKSSLLCINFFAHHEEQQWTVTLDKGETIECVCTGKDFVAIATNTQMIRTFTIGGFQLAPYLLPGIPVALSGYSNILMSVYHTAPAVDNQQYMSVSILTVTTPFREILTHNSNLPLPAKAQLLWMGFTTEGTPAIYDSNGFLSLYRIHGHDIWTPVLNTKTKDKNHLHFIVGISESPNQIRSVITKSNKPLPVDPRPLVSVSPFLIPLCGMNTDIGKQEEIVWRNRLMNQATNYWLCDKTAHVNNYEKDEQSTLLKLFSVACKEERFEKAYQITHLMTVQYMKLAAQYANRTHNVELAQKISLEAAEKAGEDETGGSNVFRIDQPYCGAYNHVKRSADDSEEEAGADDLARFTSSRFSTTPNKELTAALHSQRSQSSQKVPQASQREYNSQNSTDSGAMRTSFQNVLEDNESTDLPLDTSGRPKINPFKSKTPLINRHVTIEELQKKSQELEAQKLEKKKTPTTLKPLQKNTRQTKLFEAKLDESSSAVNNENSNTEKSHTVVTTKLTAFDLYFNEEYNSEADRRPDALETFKNLSKDKKKEYAQKANSMNQSASTVTNNTESDKKRKIEAADSDSQEDTTPIAKRQVLATSDNTKSRLAAFKSS